VTSAEKKIEMAPLAAPVVKRHRQMNFRALGKQSTKRSVVGKEGEVNVGERIRT
jgi:hypothetical protein